MNEDESKNKVKFLKEWYEAIAYPSAELCAHRHATHGEAENCDRWGRPAVLLVTKVEVVGCGYRWGSLKGTENHRNEQHECRDPPHVDMTHSCAVHPCNAEKKVPKNGGEPK